MCCRIKSTLPCVACSSFHGELRVLERATHLLSLQESDSELADRLRKMGEDGVLQAQVVEDIINSCGKTEGLRDEEAEVLFQEMLQAFKGEEEEKVRSLA
eukprot:Sspe_Gene.98534::Locus_71939_Transcript_1_4_Confidence_0.625_Length_393::g.98534::m.98534